LPQTPIEVALRDALAWFVRAGRLRLPARAVRRLVAA